jgi:hypothetical protein
MQLVLALLVAFVLCGAVWPQIVRNRAYFLIGLAALVAAMVLHALGDFLGDWLGHGLMHFIANLFEIASLVLFVLCAGGMSAAEFIRDVRRTFVRR